MAHELYVHGRLIYLYLREQREMKEKKQKVMTEEMKQKGEKDMRRKPGSDKSVSQYAQRVHNSILRYHPDYMPD